MIERFPLSELQIDPGYRDLFAPASPERRARIKASLHRYGQHRPLIASIRSDGTAVLLAGMSSRLPCMLELGRTHARVIVRHGLGPLGELRELARDNREESDGRDHVSEEEYFRVEALAWSKLKRGQGRRTDLTSASPAGEKGFTTRQLVARVTGQSENAVAERRLIFASPHSTDEIREALRQGRISRNEAVRQVRSRESLAERGAQNAISHSEGASRPGKPDQPRAPTHEGFGGVTTPPADASADQRGDQQNPPDAEREESVGPRSEASCEAEHDGMTAAPPEFRIQLHRTTHGMDAIGEVFSHRVRVMVRGNELVLSPLGPARAGVTPSADVTPAPASSGAAVVTTEVPRVVVAPVKAQHRRFAVTSAVESRAVAYRLEPPVVSRTDG